MPYGKLTVTKIGDVDCRAIWELHKPFEWTNGIMKIIVPVGFQCDFASIPQFALSILGDIGQEAGVVHDYLYRSDIMVIDVECSHVGDPSVPITRQYADYIFYEICGEMGIEYWKRWSMWKAVRLCAKPHWQKRKVMEPFIESNFNEW